MSSDALSRFEVTFGDARKLLPASTSFDASSYQAHQCRFAIVFAVASMDSYFTKKFTDNLTPFLKARGVTDNLETRMKKAHIGTKFFLELMRAEDFSTKKDTRPFKKIHTKIKISLGSYTSQSTKKIDELFRAYEIKDVSEKALVYARKNSLLSGIRLPQKRLEKIIKKRHQIVHSNDFNLVSKYNKIDSNKTREDLKVIEAFVKGADAIIDEELNKFL